MTTTEATIAGFIQEKILRSDAAISPDVLLLEQGVLDSLGLQQLVQFLESDFGVQLDDDQLLPENFESIRSVARLVDNLKR